MTPTIRKLLSLFTLLMGDKCVFVPTNMIDYFVEYCKAHNQIINGGLANAEGQYFYL